MLTRYPVLLLTLISTAVRLLTLGADNLWFDESFTALVAHPQTDFWGAVMGDTHPPLWSLIQALNVRLFRDFAYTSFGFRLPAFLFSVASVVLLYHIAKRLTDDFTAIHAGLLAALLPPFIYFGQDGRMYALLTFCVLLTLWAALRRNYYWFGLGALGAIYTHNVGLLYVAAIGGVAVLTSKDWTDRLKAAMGLGVPALFYLPWALTLFRQAGAVGESFWLPPANVLNALEHLAAVTVGWRLPKPLTLHILVICYGLSAVALWQARPWFKRGGGLHLLALILGAPLMLFGVSVLWRNIMVFRALLPAGMGWMILWASTLSRLPMTVSGDGVQYLGRGSKLLREVSLPLFAIATASYLLYGTGRENLVAFEQPLKEGWQQGDVVYFTNPTQAVQHWLYLDKDFYLRPSKGDILNLTEPVKVAFHLKEAEKPLSEVESCRAWVMTQQNPFTRRDEVEYLNDILTTYPHQLAFQVTRNENTVDSLYLVNLPCLVSSAR